MLFRSEFQVRVIELAEDCSCHHDRHFDCINQKQSCSGEAIADAVEEEGDAEGHNVNDDYVLPQHEWERTSTTLASA